MSLSMSSLLYALMKQSNNVEESFDNCDAFYVDKEKDVITIQEEAAMDKDMLHRIIHARTQEQMKRGKVDNGITVRFHHDVLNPLSSSWKSLQKCMLFR